MYFVFSIFIHVRICLYFTKIVYVSNRIFNDMDDEKFWQEMSGLIGNNEKRPKNVKDR